MTAEPTDQAIVLDLLRGAVPERADDLSRLWLEHGHGVEVAPSAPGSTMNATSKRIKFDTKTIDFFWLLGFSAWRAIEVYAPALTLATATGVTLEAALNIDEERGQFEQDYRHRIASAQSLLNAAKTSEIDWPEDIPQPTADRESFGNGQDMAVFDLVALAVAFALLHEFKHVQARALEAAEQTPEEDRQAAAEEEIACDTWAREFMTTGMAAYAAPNGYSYRYYISHRLVQAQRQEKDGWRLPAQQIETIVLDEITGLFRSKVRLLDICGLINCDPNTASRAIASGNDIAEQLETGTMDEKRNSLKQIIQRIVLQPDAITIEIDRAGLAKAIGIEMGHEEVTAETGEDVRETDTATIRLRIQLRRRGVEAKLVLTDAQPRASNADLNLIRLLGQARHLADQLISGKAGSITELANATGLNAAEISRILPLAFLAPDIVRDILDGRQPPELTSDALKRIDTLPILWKDQRTPLGFIA
ncbi:MAG: hypothetical protein KDJ90_12505 [Nitratireductor sp.]|nr:hypothetical protein [Nitratireductor sp.]